MERCLLATPTDQLSTAELLHASNVLFSPCMLSCSCPLLGVLGVADTGQLVPRAQRSLEAALADGSACQPADAAWHAVRLAAFVARGVQCSGEAAGLDLAAPQAQQAVRQRLLPALQQLSGSGRAAAQARALLQAVQAVPAVAGAVDALLHQGLWPGTVSGTGSQSEQERAQDLRDLSRFVSWVGRSAAAIHTTFAAAVRTDDAAASIAEAWLLVQTRLLQLHAACPPGTGSSPSGSSSGDSSASAASGGGDGADVMHSFKTGLAQCSDGLSMLLNCLSAFAPEALHGASRGTTGSRTGAAAGSGAGAAGQHPLLHTMLQLVTTTSLTAHLAAGMVQRQPDQQLWLAQVELLACRQEDMPAVPAAHQLLFASMGLSMCLEGPWQLPQDPYGQPAAAALEVGR